MLLSAVSAAQCLKAQHRGMFAVDIVAFSRRDPDLQLYQRAALYQIVEESCEVTDISWNGCYQEDRGDGLLAITHGDVSIEVLLDTFVTQIRTRLRKHNKMSANRSPGMIMTMAQ